MFVFYLPNVSWQFSERVFVRDGGHDGNVKVWVSIGLLQHVSNRNTFNACSTKILIHE